MTYTECHIMVGTNSTDIEVDFGNGVPLPGDLVIIEDAKYRVTRREFATVKPALAFSERYEGEILHIYLRPNV